MTPSILDYHSTTPTYALAFSPLSKPTPSLAIGSYVESSFTSENHVTVIGLDESYLEYEDDSSSSSNDDDDDDGQREEEDEDEIMSDPTPARPSSPLPLSARTKTGSKILLGSAFVPLARAPHSYPPSAVAFSPEQLSSSLQASNGGTKGEGTREMVASSSDCLRLWDLRGQGEESVSGGRKRTTNLSSNYVGERGRGRNGTGMELIPRAVLANVRIFSLRRGKKQLIRSGIDDSLKQSIRLLSLRSLGQPWNQLISSLHP
jgi:WD repeat-containing protein 68